MNRKIKNILLLVLLLVVLGMTVGYAALAQLLNINGTANITASWDIKITNIVEGTLNGAKSKKVEVVPGDKLSATFDVDLLYPGASATYIVTVQNAGTIDAKLESITGLDTANSSAPTEITYSINATENDALNNGESKDYTVTVKWEDTNAIPEVKTKSATITLNYVQAM